jgi:hypothetical protein
MTALRLILPLAAGLSLSSPALAADSQAWQTVGANVTLTPAVKIQAELVVRESQPRGLYEVEQTTLLAYKTGNVTVAAGYVHNPTYDHGDFVAMERRAREQVTIDNLAKLGPFKLSARMRAEQRWRDNVPGTGWRARPYLKATAPLIGKLALTLSHESFINLNTAAFQKVSGYDRMRNAISIGVPLAKGVSADVGYLNQYTFVRRAPNTSNNALTTGVTFSF